MQRRTTLNVCERYGRRHACSQKCPASNKDCRRYQKKDHFEISCCSRHVNEISTIEVTDRSDYLNKVDVAEISLWCRQF
ncbi:hypothetical protein GJ496_002805 [Pomphorhynchus laevis]|nr:hypothetical protein GJ496_002805 [Pomphorhynchus laevis]